MFLLTTWQTHYQWTRLPLVRRHSLQLVVGTKNVDNLVFVHLLHVFASRLQVLARVEVFRMFVEILTDSGSHGEAAVRVDVDLADS